MHTLRLRLAARALLVTTAVTFVVASCAEGPTTPVVPCPLVAVGAPISLTVGSAAALRPMLEDVRDRVLPAIASADLSVDESVASLTSAVASGNRAAACDAFNLAATAFLALEPVALPEEAPDVEVVRLALRFTRNWLAAN